MWGGLDVSEGCPPGTGAQPRRGNGHPSPPHAACLQMWSLGLAPGVHFILVSDQEKTQHIGTAAPVNA